MFLLVKWCETRWNFSPIIDLYCIYFVELLIRIRDSGLGCHVGCLSYTGVDYADDVITAAPSPSLVSLLLLYICENFAKDFNVFWNCGKLYVYKN